jgi:cob(I)alamin adenosyltransferase
VQVYEWAGLLGIKKINGRLVKSVYLKYWEWICGLWERGFLFRTQEKNSEIRKQKTKQKIKYKIQAPLKGGGVVIDDDSPQAHTQAANKALEHAKTVLLQQTYDVLVLDEINSTVFDKLLSLSQITYLLSQRGKTHLVLTGRNAPEELISQVDLVTEMNKLKHPYDQGIQAVKGLDF